MQDLIFTIFYILRQVIYIYSILIIIYTLFTWVPALYNSKIGEILGRIVEPYLNLFERLIPPIAGISFAPVAALFVLFFIENYVLVWIFNIIFHLTNGII